MHPSTATRVHSRSEKAALLLHVLLLPLGKLVERRTVHLEHRLEVLLAEIRLQLRGIEAADVRTRLQTRVRHAPGAGLLRLGCGSDFTGLLGPLSFLCLLGLSGSSGLPVPLCLLRLLFLVGLLCLLGLLRLLSLLCIVSLLCLVGLLCLFSLLCLVSLL